MIALDACARHLPIAFRYMSDQALDALECELDRAFDAILKEE
jgi:hypothetical protein